MTTGISLESHQKSSEPCDESARRVGVSPADDARPQARSRPPEAKAVGRVVGRVLAVNPRPRTSIDEKRRRGAKVAENTAEKRLEAHSNHLAWTSRVNVDWRGRRDSNPKRNTVPTNGC